MSAIKQEQTDNVSPDNNSAGNGMPENWLEYYAARNAIMDWPLEFRVALVHDLINAIARASEPPKSRRGTLERAIGLLSNGNPPPSDEEVERIIDEYRQEKYG